MKARLPVQINSAQRKAINEEIYRQIVENDIKYSLDLDSAVLFILHEEFGFGKKRLKQFWDAFLSKHKELQEYYQLPPGSHGWLCRRLLKDIGVDLEQWYEEAGL